MRPSDEILKFVPSALVSHLPREGKAGKGWAFMPASGIKSEMTRPLPEWLIGVMRVRCSSSG